LAYDQGVGTHQATNKENKVMRPGYENLILRAYRMYASQHRKAILRHKPLEEEAFYAFMINAIAAAAQRSNDVDRRRRLFDGICAIDLELAEKGRGQ
jgi:hypothetical protein